jgi:hypothetical protein
VIESAEFTINAWDHAVDFVVEPPRPEDPIAALKASVSGGPPAGLRVPLVFTGISAGTIQLAVEVLDHEPAAIAPGWEDVLEVSLTIPEGKAYFNRPTGSDVHDIGALDAGEAGSYRARLHATGRDTDYDLVVDSSKERHLVQLWKAPPADTVVLANTSSAGKTWERFVEMWHNL